MVLALIAFLFPLAYSPGPGNAFFAAIGASRGLRAALPALAGYHVATFVVTVAIGVGMELTILADPRVIAVLSVLGSLYVFWIGIAFLRAAMAAADTDAEAGTGPSGVSFVDGAVVLLLNPKAYLIIGLLFTQFLRAGEDRVGTVVKVTTVFTVNNLIAFIVWAVAGAAIARLFQGARAGRIVNMVFALCLIGVAAWMIVPAFAG